MSFSRRWLIPSYGTILTLAALASGLVLRASNMFAHDGDGARHIRLGREILQRGRVLDADIFSHTRYGEPIVLHEWLSEVALAGADILARLPGVAVLAALLLVVSVLGVYRSAEELGAPRPLALGAGVLAIPLQSLHLLPRPHLFSTAFAAVFMVVLLRFARTNRPLTLAALPILMVVWANLHGGFLLGIVLITAFLVGSLLRSCEFSGGRRAARPVGLVLLLCVAATLLTPHGVELWTYTTGHLGTDDFLLSVTEEFQSVDFHAGYGKFFFVILFAAPVIWMTGRVRVSWLGAGLYLFFAASALHSARNIPLFSLAVLPWFALWTDQALQKGGFKLEAVRSRLWRMDRDDRKLRPWIWIIPGAGLIAWALGAAPGLYRFDPSVFPVEAVESPDAIDTSGKVFNQMHWGGYLLYRQPRIRVFIDGQTDFYGEQLAREYLAVLHGRPEWREILDRYDVDWTLTSSMAPIVQLLDLDPEWRRHYADDVATVFRREVGVP